MRVMRSTMWKNPNDKVTTVVRAPDVIVSLEEMQRHLLMPGFVVTFEIFAVPDGTSIESSTHEALRRFEERADRERNQAVMFFWNGGVLHRLNPGGRLMPTRPAPLTADELEPVMAQLALHPDYRSQTVGAFSEDGVGLLMKDGIVTRETDPRHGRPMNG
jgi:hypothetical protein